MIADITDTKTGQKAGGVLVDKEAVYLLKQFPYWRAYFFRVGLGLKEISEAALKAATDGDYRVQLMDRGRVVWEG